ncbi:MAG: hypothetical protein E7C07_03540 [Enterobacter sp.]|nr:hypothetical protein [Enterobacter sp.]
MTWIWLILASLLSCAGQLCQKQATMLSLNFVWVTLAAKVFWRENVALHHWLGVGLIIIGIVILGGSL